MEANENIIVTNVTFKQSGRIACLFMSVHVGRKYLCQECDQEFT